MTDHLEAKLATAFGELARALCRYLERTLPRLQADAWWERLVVAKLSTAQADRLRQTHGHDLSALDLAALLRVFDANWWEICNRDSLPSDCRHYLKEMQSVRNRWAHAAAALPPADTIFRDLDTVQRLLSAVEPKHPAIAAVDDLKRQVLQLPTIVADSATAREASPPAGSMPPPPASSTLFAPGQLVRLKSDPGKTGVIMKTEPGSPEERLIVFVDGASRPFYASQLLSDHEPAAAEPDLAPADVFHACLTAAQIAHPGASALFSLNAARIDFIPYQFRPVIKFIRADRPRLLIADSVGVGKTIEAGLILRELSARQDVANVLIVCPRPLVAERKWETEMRRFDERFTPLDGPALQLCIDEMYLEGKWDPRHSRVIVPYSLFDERLLHGEKGRRRRKGLLDLEPPPRFDLVIVDEAHHIRNPNTYAHQAVKFFCDHAKAVLFMTATPLQMGDEDLFVLLNTLRPDWVVDRASYAAMAAPNPHVNQAAAAARGAGADWRTVALDALEAAAATDWGKAAYPGDPDYLRAREILATPACDDRARVEAITAIERLHTFASLVNRTRRRDIGDFTVRKPETLAVDFTPAQRQLHDDLLGMHRLLLSRRHGGQCLDFMMTTLKRQAASCIFGLAPLIGDILARHLDGLEPEESESALDLGDPLRQALREAADVLVREAKTLPDEDPKFDALMQVVDRKRQSPNPRLMLFSSFLHTLRYLETKLRAAGARVGLVHGAVPDPERLALRHRFMLPRDQPEAIDILLFSEVGCEGLDYQFCDTLVNYDLPWNPMRIEQRIGRLDRNGQRSEAVFIHNLVTSGTIDADIYHRCLARIGVFERSIGEGEEILGNLTRDIRAIAEDAMLSASERQAKLQQLADNQVRLAAEQNELERNQKAFFGLDLSEQRFRDDIETATSPWLAPWAVENLVDRYLRTLADTATSPLLGSRGIRTLRLSRPLRNSLLDNLAAVAQPPSEALRRWRQRLKEDAPHLKVAFSSSDAANEPDVELLSPLHPLVRQAARHLDANFANCHAALRVANSDAPPGIHPFAVYEWRREGLRREVTLLPVCANPDLPPAKLAALLAQADNWQAPPDVYPDSTVFDALDASHYQLWDAARQRHALDIRLLAEHRLQSLNTSHQTRRRILEQQLEQATDDKIRRMRTSELATANDEFHRRQTEIQTAANQADIHAQPIAWGVIKVEGNHGQ